VKKTIFILLSFVALFSLILVACDNTPAITTSAPKTTATTAPPTSVKPTATTVAPTAPAPTGDKYGGIYKIALTVAPSRPIGYPPEAAPDSYTGAAPALETLTRNKLDGSIEGVLATSWKVAADGKSITIGLRKGVKFHDGSDFNAAVAKWNMDLARDAKQSGAAAWKSIDVVDDYTIRINLESYVNTVITGLASGVTQMISKAYVDKNGIEAARWNPVGTGPFLFVSYERDAKLTFKRNPNYWDTGKPYLDGIVMTIIADATVRKLAFQKGDIMSLAPQSLLDAKELKDSGKYGVRTGGGGPYVLIPDSMNPKSPFADVRVRYALSYGLDRVSLANALGFGFAIPAYQFLQGFTDTAIPGLVPTLFDKAKAKQLMTEAGYPNGFKTTIHSFTRIVPANYISAVAAQMKDNMGIDVSIDSPTSGKYEEMRYGTWDGLMGHGLSAFENKNQDFTFYFTGLQFQYCKKPVGWQEGVDASLATPEPDPKMIQNVIQIMYDNMMFIPYIEQQAFLFRLPGVTNPNSEDYPVLTTRYQEIWLDKSLK
jgi:peptide/nickel transport system substrate-binding protein